MADAVERLVNLALLLASSPTPVTAEGCRERVAGYPEGQDDTAFIRMFERDKDELRASGLAIETVRMGAADGYRLDRDATFAPPLSFSAEELAALRAAGAALLADAGFPLREELRLALLKVLPGLPAADPATAACMPEDEAAGRDAGREGALAAEALGAISARKRVSFDYVTARGDRARREVEPWGLFAHAGGWYLVGRDVARAAPRVFALARAEGFARNATAPKSADFEPPADFDVRTYLRLPFQYGEERFTATITATSGAAPRLRRLVEGRGHTRSMEGRLAWDIEAADVDALVRWTVAHGPGLTIAAPPEAAERMRTALEEVAAAHA